MQVTGQRSDPGSLTLTPCVQATGAGAKDQEAENFLEKKLKAGTQLSQAQTAQLAISALQSVLSEDFKPSEVEVCPLRHVVPERCKDACMQDAAPHSSWLRLQRRTEPVLSHGSQAGRPTVHSDADLVVLGRREAQRVLRRWAS